MSLVDGTHNLARTFFECPACLLALLLVFMANVLVDSSVQSAIRHPCESLFPYVEKELGELVVGHDLLYSGYRPAIAFYQSLH